MVTMIRSVYFLILFSFIILAKRRSRELLRSLTRLRSALASKIISMQKTLGLRGNVVLLNFHVTADNLRSKFESAKFKLQEVLLQN